MSNPFEDWKKAQQCRFKIFWVKINDNQITIIYNTQDFPFGKKSQK